MEAVRPVIIDEEEAHAPLFEGLDVSLPSAPTEKPDVGAITQENADEVSRKADATSDEGLLVPIAPASTMDIQEAQRGSANFRNLYGNILQENSLGHHQVSGYPSLPSPRRAERPLDRVGENEYVPRKEGGEDALQARPDVNIEASAPPALTSSPPAPYQYSQPLQQERQEQNQTDSIIAELMSENGRLNEEVQRLLHLVQASYNQDEGKSESPPRTAPPQQQAQLEQRPLHPPPQQPQHPHQTQMRQPGADPQTQAAPSQQEKYVCCGNCRQWLQAPRAAMMVHCPSCGCVNNCELAHRRLEATQQQQLTAPPPPQQLGHRAPPQHLRHPVRQAEQWQDMSYGNGMMAPRRNRLRGPIGWLRQIVGDCVAAFQEAGDGLLEPAAASASPYREYSEHGAVPVGGATAPMIGVTPGHSRPPVEAVEMHPMADAQRAPMAPPQQRTENALLANSTITSSQDRRDYY